MRLQKILRTWHVVIIHILVWVVLFGLPMLYGSESEGALRFARRNCAMLIGLMITFYANLLWGIDKLLFKRRYVWFILFNLALFFLVSFERTALNIFFDSLENIQREEIPRHDGMRPLFMFNDFIFSILAIGASLGIRHLSSLHNIEIERKKIENETLSQELNLLRYQIRPHFFFNCLNNIYSLIGISPDKAQKAVHSLSRMMRFILYDGSNQTVTLSQEVDFLRNYISLMRLRLRQDATINLQFPDDTNSIEIPSLMFIPLVENAFKHGVGPHGEANISCLMSITDNRLSLVVENEIYNHGNERDGAHSGIGLANLQKRLHIIYADQCQFSAERVGDSSLFRAKVSVHINAHKSNA